MDDLTERACTKCKLVKPNSDFYVRDKTKGSFQSQCKRCVVARVVLTNKNNPAKSARDKEWRQKNHERMLDYDRERYHNNRESRLAASVAWRIQNPERAAQIARVSAAKRYARKLNAPTIPFTPDQLAQRWHYYGNKCWVCGEEATATDHVKPLSKGGAHMLSNLRPICKPCNSSKNNKWPYKTGVAA